MDSILLAAMDRAPLIAVGSVILLAFWIIPYLQRKRMLSKFPIHGAEHGRHLSREKAYLTSSETLYLQAYQKFRNVVHRMTTADGEKVVLPLRYLEELRQLPDDEVDSHLPIQRSLEADITGFDTGAGFLPQIIKSELTRSLTRINPALCQEVERTVRERIPASEDWTLHKVEATLLPIVTTVSGHVFVGPELSRTPEYIDACANFTVSLIRSIRALKQWPRWIRRPLGKYFTPELKLVNMYRGNANRIILPVIKQRREAMRRGDKMPDDMLQWMLAKAEGERISDDVMSRLQLTLIMSAIHTTVRGLTQIMFELASCPEVIPDLRKEIEAAMAENGGVMTTQALFQMKLLDSTMKESHRMNPSGFGRFVRYVRKPITLSDGTHLPADTLIEVPWYPVTRDETVYPGADKFDPYRCYRIRTAAEDEGGGGGGVGGGVVGRRHAKEQYQFASVTEADMTFGWGRHACPGRFFAANEIKLILARILLDYDVALPEGLDKRHENVIVGGLRIPLPGAEVRLRKRRSVG
ncbi:hypothetical protein PspLS_03008 [Pyricularia sp. CBS 133598]|nr:hypothetical protein PspLS_03008 [Pyricularia sp. CBS 133598]